MKSKKVYIFAAILTLFAGWLASCSSIGESVNEYCNCIDAATDSLKNAADIGQCISVAKNMDSELLRYRDDKTRLTDDDRQAIMSSLKAYSEATKNALLADIPPDSPVYATAVEKFEIKESKFQHKIETTLSESETLGDFVTKSKYF